MRSRSHIFWLSRNFGGTGGRRVTTLLPQLKIYSLREFLLNPLFDKFLNMTQRKYLANTLFGEGKGRYPRPGLSIAMAVAASGTKQDVQG